MSVSVILFSPHDQETRTEVFLMLFLVGTSLSAALSKGSPVRLWRAVRGTETDGQQDQRYDWSKIPLAD